MHNALALLMQQALHLTGVCPSLSWTLVSWAVVSDALFDWATVWVTTRQHGQAPKVGMQHAQMYKGAILCKHILQDLTQGQGPFPQIPCLCLPVSRPAGPLRARVPCLQPTMPTLTSTTWTHLPRYPTPLTPSPLVHAFPPCLLPMCPSAHLSICTPS